MDASERRNRASSEAADWFARLQAGNMDRLEREQFVEWLRESHVHVTEILRVAQIHGELKSFDNWARITTGPKPSAIDDNIIQLAPRSERGEGQSHSKRLMLFGTAAALVLGIATALVLPKVRGKVIETERGERREVVLGDGSVLQIDPQTRLRVKYSIDSRQIYLERGRALFHVARHVGRPFEVIADGTNVRAIGTAFGVEQQAQGVTVTVTEGQVAVSKLVLSANQQVTVATNGAPESVRQVDGHRALSWAEGRLVFQNDDLGKVITEFNRYNRVQLRIADTALIGKPVSGVFNAEDPESFIAFLQSVTTVEIVRDGDRSITIARARPR